MTRIEFTDKITKLIQKMIAEGENPIIDYALRSAQEQNHLFQEGKSKCDGYKNISYHQTGKAIDIYFIEEGKIIPPKKTFELWHHLWESIGGRPMIEWDKGHFEG